MTSKKKHLARCLFNQTTFFFCFHSLVAPKVVCLLLASNPMLQNQSIKDQTECMNEQKTDKYLNKMKHYCPFFSLFIFWCYWNSVNIPTPIVITKTTNVFSVVSAKTLTRTNKKNNLIGSTTNAKLEKIEQSKNQWIIDNLTWTTQTLKRCWNWCIFSARCQTRRSTC